MATAAGTAGRRGSARRREDLPHALDVEVLTGVAGRRRAPAVRSPRPSPLRTIATACIGLLADRGNTGVSGDPRRTAAVPSAPSPATEPRCRDSTNPERSTSTRTGFISPVSASLPGTTGPRRAASARAGRPSRRPAARSTSSAFAATGLPLAYVSVSSMPTRRWPPADRAAYITGRLVRPMPVADQVAPSGSASTAATSEPRVARHAARARPSPGRSGRARRTAARTCRADGAARRRGRGRTARTPARPPSPGSAGTARP